MKVGSFEIKPNIYWVGARDWNRRSFHGPIYSTDRGTTYNSYFIKDEKNVLIDMVYEPFAEEMAKHVEEIIPLSKIDYVVINHVEPDHSSGFPLLMDKIGDATIICTEKGKEGLEEHYGGNYTFQVVKTGDEINIGKNTLTFIEAPMLHWPDSMFTYIGQEKLLLPNDAFGQHLCMSKLFDDEVDQWIVMDEAKRYYANILTPFSSLILKKLEDVQKMDIEIDMIAPSHGVIWRNNVDGIVEAYRTWGQGKAKEKVVVVYETMWESTEKMAKGIVEGIMEEGVEVVLCRMAQSDQSEIFKELLDARALILGSATINNSIMPNLAGFLEELEVLKFKNKIGAAFGSFGWAGGAVEKLEKALMASRIEKVEERLVLKYMPSTKDLHNATEFGRNIAQKVKS